MSYTIQRISEPSAILVTFYKNFDVDVDLKPYQDDFENTMNQQSDVIPVIVDMLDWSLSFDDMMAGLQQLFGKKHPFVHPNIREVIWVTSSSLLKMSAKSFVQFGIFKQLTVVNTMVEAKSIAR